MHLLTPILLTLVSTAAARQVPRASPAWKLADDYSTGEAFFSGFSFFTEPDPTGGLVQYLGQEDAFATNLAGLNYYANSSIYLGVDNVNPAPQGRPSLRVSSNKTYSVGTLVVLDLAHMPGGICGTWPAFWLLGPSWPTDGEIDVIEGVNDATFNTITLHTGPGCAVQPQNASGYSGPKYSGILQTPDCNVNDPKQPKNAGCGVKYPPSTSFGTAFNAQGGGVYAVEWTQSAIQIWSFPRDAVPSDIMAAGANPSGNMPNPEGWGTPAAAFSNQQCDLSTAFTNQQLVFDTTFCGDWAGEVWTSSPTCMAKAPTCNQFVADNPTAFVDAYWEIKSLRVYSQ